MSGPAAADPPVLARTVLPDGGVVRVHPDPTALPSRPGPHELPHNRFDDPHGQFRVRYAASTRRGAVIEVLAGFRPHGVVEARPAAVTNTPADDQQLAPASVVPAGLLTRLRTTSIGPPSSHTWFVDVAAVASQTVLGTVPRVAAALIDSGLGTPSSQYSSTPAQSHWPVRSDVGSPRRSLAPPKRSLAVIEDTTKRPARPLSRTGRFVHQCRAQPGSSTRTVCAARTR